MNDASGATSVNGTRRVSEGRECMDILGSTYPRRRPSPATSIRPCGKMHTGLRGLSGWLDTDLPLVVSGVSGLAAPVSELPDVVSDHAPSSPLLLEHRPELGGG
jgi:hypothetical protein